MCRFPNLWESFLISLISGLVVLFLSGVRACTMTMLRSFHQYRDMQRVGHRICY